MNYIIISHGARRYKFELTWIEGEWTISNHGEEIQSGGVDTNS